MNIVIIGNSTAAIACVEAIRKHDRESAITIASSEAYPAYGRPLISYWLAGKAPESCLGYRPADFYTQNDCTLRLGTTATAIDPRAQQVTLDNGEKLHYDKLLVATGSSPVMPPIPGLATVQNAFTFTTLDDAKVLKKAVTAVSRVLIMGAGLIGLKCAEGLSALTSHITLVDLADQILPSALTADMAHIVQAHAEKQGIQVILGDGAKAFTPDTATLTSGRKLPFDILVVAVGVRPNTALVKDAGGPVGRGIVTDAYGQTSLPNVYAAGDCTESVDAVTGQIKVQALLPNAYMQGECAGLHMIAAASDGTVLEGTLPEAPALMPMNALSLWGLHMVSAGAYEGECFTAQSEGNCRRLYVKDDVLQGFMLMGDVARAGIYTALVRKKRPLSDGELTLLQDRPTLMALSPQERKKQLGGVSA